MDLQTLLDTKRISKYRLSRISGIPQTTIKDICSGRSALEKCSARTVQQLARALNCSMEDIMELNAPVLSYAHDTGLPKDKSYFECGLPDYLKSSIRKMESSWAIEDSGSKDYRWDAAWSELNADINSAEVEQIISAEQAWYLREKYLRMKRGD